MSAGDILIEVLEQLARSLMKKANESAKPPEDDEIEHAVSAFEAAALSGRLDERTTLATLEKWLSFGKNAQVSAALDRLLAYIEPHTKLLRFGVAFYLSERDFARAHRFAEVIAFGPKPSRDAFFELARIAYFRGDYRMAATWAERQLAERAEDARTMALLGQVRLRLGQLPEALAVLRATGADPELAGWLSSIVEGGRRLPKKSWLGVRDTPAPRLSRHDWRSVVLKPELMVATKTWAEIDAFINGSVYVSDQRLFGEPEHWQAPASFEARRMGDCEDFALWVWVQLLRQRIPARFVIGAQSGWQLNHAWVQVQRRSRVEVIECTPQGVNVPIHAENATEYLPLWSVDRTLTWYRHGAPSARRPDERPIVA